MVLNHERLSQSPHAFQNLTGMSTAEFQELYQALHPIYQRRRLERLSRRPRQRAIGGGRSPALELEDQLLMTLIWLRLELTSEALGLLFGVNKSTVSRNTRTVLACMQELGIRVEHRSSFPRRGRRLEDVVRDYPDLRPFVEAIQPHV